MSARECDGRRGVAAGWSFRGDLRSVARARACVRAALSPHVPAEVVEDAVLAASELATNAVRYTASGRPEGRYALAVSVLSGPAGERVRVAVVDQGGADVPRIASAAAMGASEATGGRGLGCLACLGLVGWEDLPTGRRVWAELACGGAQGTAAAPVCPDHGEGWSCGCDGCDAALTARYGEYGAEASGGAR